MNPFLVILGIAVAALVGSLHHRNGARRAAAGLARLQAEEAAAVATLSEVRARSSANSERFAEVSRELGEAMAELRADDDDAIRDRIEPSPAVEGAWPSDRPYFYLPKRLLPEIGFTPLTPDGEPTVECRSVLGMTPAEQAELRQAWADLHFELQELQLRAAERIEDAAPADPDRRSIRFRLPNISDQLPALRARLGERLAHAIGATRARLIEEPLQERLVDLGSPLGEGGGFVAYLAERDADGAVNHYLRLETADGATASQLQVGTLPADPTMSGGSELPFPIGPHCPLWNYRHLFGDQPLLRPR
jgi:hypothetical protein